MNMDESLERTLLLIAERLGYGHCIALLKKAWAILLIEEYGFSEEDAAKFVEVGKYPSETPCKV